MAAAPAGEYEQGRSLKEELVTKPVRYQEGHLYVHHEAWFARTVGPCDNPMARSKTGRGLKDWAA
jgi:hypothetical protein